MEILDCRISAGNTKGSMGRRQLLMCTLSLPALMARGEPPYYPPPDSADGWRTRRPSPHVLAKLDAAFECAKESTKHGGVLVAHRGWLVYERYFGLGSREATPNAASCGKAFTSVALGILLGERPDLFPYGLDQKVFTPHYLPEEAFPLDDPAKADIKLGQLLAMTAGLAGNNPAYVRGKEVKLTQTGPDGWPAMVDRTALTTPLWTRPGEGYCYATVAPTLSRSSCAGSPGWSCRATWTRKSPGRWAGAAGDSASGAPR